MKHVSPVVGTFIATFFILVTFTSAQTTAADAEQGMTTLASLIRTFNTTVVKALATLFMSAAVVAFFFGLTKFIWGMREGKPDVLTNGKQFMIWALVALFVMFSVYGIIRFFKDMVPGLNQSTIVIPDIQYGGGAGGGNTTPTGATPSSGANTTPTGATPAGGANTTPTDGGALRVNGDTCTLASQCISNYCQSSPYNSGQCAPNPSESQTTGGMQ